MSQGVTVVVGGGTSGLAAACVLRKAGVECAVVEERDFTGGRIASARRDGFILDLGAQFMFRRYPATLEMARRLGIAGEVVRFRPWIGVVRDGELFTLSMSALDDLLAPANTFRARRLLSARGRLQAARFAVRVARLSGRLDFDEPARSLDLDEVSLTDYVRREFGDELLEYIAQPVAGTLTLGMPEEISAAHGLALAAYMPPGLFTFRRGMGFIAEQMARRVADIRLETSAKRIVIEGDEVRGVVVDSGEGTEFIEADNVVCAVPANRASELLADLPGAMQGALKRVRYSSCVHVMLAFERPPFGRVFAVATPRRERFGFAGFTENSLKSPNYAPAGCGILHVYTYGPAVGEFRGLPADEVGRRIIAELRRIEPSVPDEPLFCETFYWPEALCLAGPGHAGSVMDLDSALRRYRGLFLAGEYFGVPSAEAAIHSGMRAATRLLNT